jgi:hypothetical protein
MFSDKFLAALKRSETPAYRLAQRTGLNPVTLSQMIHGARRVEPSDPRLVKLGELLGLQAHEVFVAEGGGV